MRSRSMERNNLTRLRFSRRIITNGRLFSETIGVHGSDGFSETVIIEQPALILGIMTTLKNHHHMQ